MSDPFEFKAADKREALQLPDGFNNEDRTQLPPLRVSVREREQLEQLAANDNRTLSAYLKIVIRKHLQRENSK